jgi:hypothetical protein
MGGSQKSVRIGTLKTFSSIVVSSPVDEGRFRGAWTATGHKPSAVIGPIDKNGSKTIARMNSVILGLKDWSVFTFTNNTPQALPIEFGLYPKNPKKGTWNKKKGAYEIRSINGFSQQADQGVVRINIARAQKNIENEARKHLPK